MLKRFPISATDAAPAQGAASAFADEVPNGTEPATAPAASGFWASAWWVIVPTVALTVGGLLVLSSAGAKGLRAGDGPFVVFKHQLAYAAIAVSVALVTYFVNLEKLRRYVWWIFGATCFALVLVRIPIPGLCHPVNGSWRWINLGFFNVQVSDVAKVALTLALAHYLATAQRYLRPKYFRFFEGFPRLLETRSGFPWVQPATAAGWDLWHGFAVPCGIIGAVCGLIAIETDLGTMVLCGMVGTALLFVSGVRLFYLLPILTLAATGLSLVVYYWQNRLNRVLSFLDPEGTKLDQGYQLWQGMLAFACGGIKGRGLGQGMQQYHYLPEAHTDFILSIIGEEGGLCFTAAAVVCFLIIFTTVVINLPRAHNLFQFNVCLGAMLFIVLQAIINMGVVIDLLPTKGMSLPFISYGGTNLVVMFTMIGLILNCFRLWSRPPKVRTSEL